MNYPEKKEPLKGDVAAKLTPFEKHVAQGNAYYYIANDSLLGCSHEFASGLGYTVAELIGTASDIIIPPEVATQQGILHNDPHCVFSSASSRSPTPARSLPQGVHTRGCSTS
jgi:hypothetical protein